MDREKLQNRLGAMAQVKQVMDKRPCGICTDKSKGAYQFKPKYPANFGIEQGRSLIIPICARCLEAGVDDDFLEATLNHSGIRRTIDESQNSDGGDQG